MLIIGLTGGIGSGKTLVATLFSKLGIPVYNADEQAKELMQSHSVVERITKVFGEKAYVDGKLNRPFIASIVFNNKSQLNRLNSIVHPAVREDFKSWLKTVKSDYVIREAAILFESQSYKDCDKIITVTAPEELRIERVMNRDKVKREDVLARIKNQWPEEKKTKLSDFIIINDGKAELSDQVKKIHEQLLKTGK